MSPTREPVKNVLWRLSAVMLVVAALLPLTYFFPRFDLNGPLARSAYWIAESGGAIGIPLLTITMTALVVGRAGLSGKQRAVEGMVIVPAVAAEIEVTSAEALAATPLVVTTTFRVTGPATSAT